MLSSSFFLFKVECRTKRAHLEEQLRQLQEGRRALIETIIGKVFHFKPSSVAPPPPPFPLLTVAAPLDRSTTTINGNKRVLLIPLTHPLYTSACWLSCVV